MSSAGQIDAGEDSLTSALRETNEELGLALQRGDLERLFTLKEQELLNNGTYVNNEFQDVYLVTLHTSDLVLHFQDKEVTAVRWIPFRELEKLINARDPSFVPHDNEYKKLFAILHKRYSPS
ncbi:NUDIX domain-containing protein [Candidatus Uhrbacteria bacterium]|nr:NUDIX domain-containing protein [Candidatus Uhrbacteria bacterium]